MFQLISKETQATVRVNILDFQRTFLRTLMRKTLEANLSVPKAVRRAQREAASGRLQRRENEQLQFGGRLDSTMTKEQPEREEEHAAMKSNNIMIQTLVSLYWPVTPHPPYTRSSAFHSALNCPKEAGVGRYESTYLLAFVQRVALSERVLELLTSSPA